MLSFCLATQPVWCRVMERHPTARAVAFADDGFVHDDLLKALLACADIKTVTKEDSGLDLQLLKCTVYIKGHTIQEDRRKVRDCIESDEALHGLRNLLHESGNPADDPIQVDGIKCVGIPVGTDQYTSTFVYNKVLSVAQDVQKLSIMSDPLVHLHLLKYCQNTRFGYLNRILPPP